MLGALEKRDAALAASLLVHHIDHIEADLDLRPASGLGLREAVASE
jgi:DNA-binding GntR family transcriptional regulator